MQKNVKPVRQRLPSTIVASAIPQLIRRYPPLPSIRITPYAWAKLLFLRDAGPTEIGGFGISAEDDLLLVRDVDLVLQDADWASVAFDDASVADYYDRQVELGRNPSEFARIWIHTHPGNSPQPSATDEETFARAFGGCEWAVMLIVARGGASYARLTFAVGPGGGWEVPVRVDFETPFAAADPTAWQAEYDACVQSPPEALAPPDLMPPYHSFLEEEDFARLES